MSVSDHVDLDQFVAGVQKRNPGQPEFVQAVQEVADSLVVVLDKHPEYQDLYARAVHLYKEITETALKNEKGA